MRVWSHCSASTSRSCIWSTCCRTSDGLSGLGPGSQVGPVCSGARTPTLHRRPARQGRLVGGRGDGLCGLTLVTRRQRVRRGQIGSRGWRVRCGGPDGRVRGPGWGRLVVPPPEARGGAARPAEGAPRRATARGRRPAARVVASEIAEALDVGTGALAARGQIARAEARSLLRAEATRQHRRWKRARAMGAWASYG